MRRFGYRSNMRTTAKFPAIASGKRFWRTLLFIFFWLTACTTQSSGRVQTSAPPISDPNIAAFISGWQDYADQINALPPQDGCQPEFMRATPAIPREGAVVMFHGFGGCPQQFIELGRLVAAQGFDVLLPLLPGHGAVPGLDGKEDLSRLPAADDGETRYAEHARRINEIMARSPGTRVIVGFSLGGAISFSANMQAPALYDRHLMLSPMFAIRGGAFVEGLAGFLGRVPGVRSIVVKPASKRQECRDWESAGRAGFCDYQLRHVVALLQLEETNRRIYRESGFSTPVQIVAAGNEDYVSNEQIVNFVRQQEAKGPISLCFMPADVPHEMLSPYENSGIDMYWLNDLLGNSVSFITGSGFFPEQNAAQETKSDESACRIHAPPA
jgi:alpha-beta hydrolase superfamily lysophospholipase